MNTFQNSVDLAILLTGHDIVKLFLPSLVSTLAGVMVTPFITNMMIKYNLQKVKSVAKTVDGRPATITQKLHNDENKVLYRMGALVVIVGVAVSLSIFRLLPVFFNSDTVAKLNFLSSSQTWLPLFAFLIGAIIGAVDDLIVCGRLKKLASAVGGGLSLKVRLGMALVIALGCAWWMTTRLDMSQFYIPFIGTYTVHWALFSLAVVVAVVVSYAGGVIDGIDGLAGGIFSLMYSTMGIIALLQQRFDLAALCFAVVGGLLAFLWFNIPPARFMLSDVGSMPLTIMLAIIAVLTDSLFVLPIITLPLWTSIGSVVIQLVSKKLRGGKKVFLVSPVHNHFQAMGWPPYKVVMRYWVITSVCCSIGLLVFVSGGYFG